MKSITIALLTLLGISSTYSTTIHVPADQPTIQAGINEAVNGDYGIDLVDVSRLVSYLTGGGAQLVVGC
jgi:hypothetical protein